MSNMLSQMNIIKAPEEVKKEKKKKWISKCLLLFASVHHLGLYGPKHNVGKVWTALTGSSSTSKYKYNTQTKHK